MAPINGTKKVPNKTKKDPCIIRSEAVPAEKNFMQHISARSSSNAPEALEQLIPRPAYMYVSHLALPTAPVGRPGVAAAPTAGVRGGGDKLLHVLSTAPGEDAAEEDANARPTPLPRAPPSARGDGAVTGNAYEAPSIVAAAASSFRNPTPPLLPLAPLLPPLGLVPTRR